MKGLMYLFFAFMLVACGDAGTTETTTESNSETTGAETGTSGDATTTGTTPSAAPSATTTSEAASPFPENEQMAFYCKKLYNKIIGGNYNTATTETYTKAFDLLGVATFKGQKLKDAEVRMMSMDFKDKESTIKLAEFSCNPVLPAKPVITDYYPRGKHMFYDQGECGCIQIHETKAVSEGQAGAVLENVFYYKKGKLVAVYDDKDQAVEITEAHKTLSVENLTQFEAIKKIE